MPEFVVAGALVEQDGGLLLVHNRRRGGFSDWSTPGGVIDDSDDSVLAGLTREVEEETGLRVTAWEGPMYEVCTVAPDAGWTMRALVFRALDFEGSLVVDDPDGIVVDAAFVPLADCRVQLERCHPWVGGPIADWLRDRWGPGALRTYHYQVRGASRDVWATELVRIV
jgi:8-oxo-dGTP diphosphatase